MFFSIYRDLNYFKRYWNIFMVVNELSGKNFNLSHFIKTESHRKLRHFTEGVFNEIFREKTTKKQQEKKKKNRNPPEKNL